MCMKHGGHESSVLFLIPKRDQRAYKSFHFKNFSGQLEFVNLQFRYTYTQRYITNN